MPDESKMDDTTPTSGMVSAPNLKQMDVSTLRKFIIDAQTLETKKVEQEKNKLLSDFRLEAAKLGFSVSVAWSDLPTPEPDFKAPKKTKGKAQAKYRGPNGEESTGLGRPSKWLTDLEAAGHKREEFLIPEE